jgi:glutamine synthetase
VADVLAEFADKLENASDFTAELDALVKQTIIDHDRIIFNGNGYSEEWVEEAKKRGLLNLLSTIDALPAFITPENIELFDRNSVLSPVETTSRYELLLEAYCTIIHIESNSMLEIAHRGIVPAVINYIADVAKSLGGAAKTAEKLGIKVANSLQKVLFAELTSLADDLNADIKALEAAQENEPEGEVLTVATYYKETIIAAQEKLRGTVDALEQIVDSDYWPLPSYGDILYSVK